jgi:uncharacterized protein YqfA (UPF0365 family)
MNHAQPDTSIVAIAAVMAALVSLFVLLIVAVVFASLFGPWLRAFVSGVPVSVIQLLGMRFRRIPPGLIVDALIALVHRGHSYNSTMCYWAESIYLAERGLIGSPQELADAVEKRMKAEGAEQVSRQ